MKYAKVYGAQLSVLTPYLVSVEADILTGGNSFTVVGLPDKAVEESRDRVAAAVAHAGFDSPKKGLKKTVVSLAPADLKKEGPMFDVAIALAYLLAIDDVRFDPEPYVFIGELALDGAIRPIKGVLPLAAHAKKIGKQAIFVPKENEREAALVEGIAVYGVHTLIEVIAHLNNKKNSKHERVTLTPAQRTTLAHEAAAESRISLEDIRGQETAKRAATIAAAGGHNVGLWGSPGTGKTMLARALASLLPPLSFEEALEVNGIHSVAGYLGDSLITNPPFRSPHHTSSYVSVVGGGSTIRPGEATLAHRGVLFMDEFPEFDRRVLESLRQPLEDRVITVARAKGTAQFPARFMLVAAMNPCPCGKWGHPTQTCTCAAHVLEKYRRKISGPIADRIDLWSEMGPVELSELGKRGAEGEETKEARAQVARAREIQTRRYGSSKTNSDLSARELDALVPLESAARKVLAQAGNTLELSPRAYHRTLKVARTIADLDGSEELLPVHVHEALQYRQRTE